MKVKIGIDIGGSTTKIIGLYNGSIVKPLLIKADDPITSLFGAFGKFIYENNIDISNIDKIMITGVGATYVNSNIYGIETVKVPEFDANGLGGLYLSNKEKALVVSLGTGTSIVEATKNESNKYVGGTAIGGGTIIGLCKKLINTSKIEKIVDLANLGDLSQIDLTISDITENDFPHLENGITASNFGKMLESASDCDIALGVLNMVFQSIAMTSVFAVNHSDFNDVVLIGNLSRIEYCQKTFNSIMRFTGVNFIFPNMSEFATALGALLYGNN